MKRVTSTRHWVSPLLISCSYIGSSDIDIGEHGVRTRTASSSVKKRKALRCLEEHNCLEIAVPTCIAVEVRLYHWYGGFCSREKWLLWDARVFLGQQSLCKNRGSSILRWKKKIERAPRRKFKGLSVGGTWRANKKFLLSLLTFSFLLLDITLFLEQYSFCYSSAISESQHYNISKSLIKKWLTEWLKYQDLLYLSYFCRPL
jgi:hypothetical protein